MKRNRLIVLGLYLLMGTLGCMFASMIDSPVKLSSEDAYHARAVSAERTRAKAEYEREQLWMQNVFNAFVENNPQVKEHRDLSDSKAKEYEAKTSELKELESQLLTAAKLKPDSWHLDAENGQLIPLVPVDSTHDTTTPPKEK